MNFVCPVGQCGKNCKNVGGLQSHLFHVHKIEEKKRSETKEVPEEKDLQIQGKCSPRALYGKIIDNEYSRGQA